MIGHTCHYWRKQIHVKRGSNGHRKATPNFVTAKSSRTNSTEEQNCWSQYRLAYSLRVESCNQLKWTIEEVSMLEVYHCLSFETRTCSHESSLFAKVLSSWKKVRSIIVKEPFSEPLKRSQMFVASSHSALVWILGIFHRVVAYLVTLNHEGRSCHTNVRRGLF